MNKKVNQNVTTNTSVKKYINLYHAKDGAYLYEAWISS